MDIKKLLINIKRSLIFTENPVESAKWLVVLYNLKAKLGYKSLNKSLIKFKYPYPLAKFKLLIRSNIGSDTFIISEVFDEECYKINTSRKIESILDLGANAGFTAVYFSKCWPNSTIACVEPMPDNIESLKQNLLLNKVKSKVFEAAISPEIKEISMVMSDNDYGHKVSDIKFGKSVGNVTITVEGISVKEVMTEMQWETIDLVKIDIEGYEGILLAERNEWLAGVNLIIMEIHEGVDELEIKKIMASYGLNEIKYYKGNVIFSRLT